MNYIKEAEEELKKYHDLCKALEVIANDLKVINFDLTNVKANNYEGFTGGCSVNGDDAVANLVFKKQVKERAYKSTNAKIKNIEKALRNIEKNGEQETEDRKIIEMFYFDNIEKDRCADNLHISRATFHRRKYIALKRFSMQYFGDLVS